MQKIKFSLTFSLKSTDPLLHHKGGKCALPSLASAIQSPRQKAKRRQGISDKRCSFQTKGLCIHCSQRAS